MIKEKEIVYNKENEKLQSEREVIWATTNLSTEIANTVRNFNATIIYENQYMGVLTYEDDDFLTVVILSQLTDKEDLKNVVS